MVWYSKHNPGGALRDLLCCAGVWRLGQGRQAAGKKAAAGTQFHKLAGVYCKKYIRRDMLAGQNCFDLLM